MSGCESVLCGLSHIGLTASVAKEERYFTPMKLRVLCPPELVASGNWPGVHASHDLVPHLSNEMGAPAPFPEITVATLSSTIPRGSCFLCAQGNFTNLAGGVGNGYFACKAGDAGSTPVLGESSGRLNGKTPLSVAACSPANFFPALCGIRARDGHGQITGKKRHAGGQSTPV